VGSQRCETSHEEMKMKERDHKKNKFVNHISAFGETGIDPCW
jgi:hypothetical protein